MNIKGILTAITYDARARRQFQKYSEIKQVHDKRSDAEFEISFIKACSRFRCAKLNLIVYLSVLAVLTLSNTWGYWLSKFHSIMRYLYGAGVAESDIVGAFLILDVMLLFCLVFVTLIGLLMHTNEFRETWEQRSMFEYLRSHRKKGSEVY